MYLFFNVTMQGHVIMGSYGRKLLIVCDHHAKFVGHKHCSSGDVMFLIYYMISCDHLLKGLFDFIQRNFFLIVSHHLPKFGCHSPCGSRDMTHLIFQVTLQGHVIKQPLWLAVRKLLIFPPCQVW